MRTEKEIREEIKNSLNVIGNSKFLYEETTAPKFLENAKNADIWKNALLWVLKEFEPETKIITLNVESGDVT